MVKVIKPGHLYELGNHEDHKVVQLIQFIEKEAQPDGSLKLVTDGTTNEQVIDVLINRLAYLHKKLPDPYTKAARLLIGLASSVLQERTADRKKRKVEGTPKA